MTVLYLTVNPESINKALAAFRRQGLIRLQRGEIIVVNPQTLWEYVN